MIVLKKKGKYYLLILFLIIFYYLYHYLNQPKNIDNLRLNILETFDLTNQDTTELKRIFLPFSFSDILDSKIKYSLLDFEKIKKTAHPEVLKEIEEEVFNNKKILAKEIQDVGTLNIYKKNDLKLQILKELKKIKTFSIDKLYKNQNLGFLYQLKDTKNSDYGNLTIKRYETKYPFLYGLNLNYPGSAYFANDSNSLYLISASGIIAKSDMTHGELDFKQIRNNTNDFINSQQFGQANWFSFKDALIDDGNMYLSFTNEIKPYCWNISIIKARLNKSYLDFKPFFTPEVCYHSNRKFINFSGHITGGRIISLDKDSLALTIGTFNQNQDAKDIDSIFGRILKLNKEGEVIKVISKGHRNPQGLTLMKNGEFLIETEHGPRGGDEVNIISNNKLEEQDFGWPTVSYGKDKDVVYSDSHAKYGFIEPTQVFVPSIGISEIREAPWDENTFFFGSMAKGTLYQLRFNKNSGTNIESQINFGERVRDIAIFDGKLYLFLETSASIVEISNNSKIN